MARIHHSVDRRGNIDWDNSPELEARLKELCTLNMSSAAIANSLGLSKDQVIGACRRRKIGLPHAPKGALAKPPPVLSPEDMTEFRRMCEIGVTRTRMCERFGTSYYFLRKICRHFRIMWVPGFEGFRTDDGDLRKSHRPKRGEREDTISAVNPEAVSRPPQAAPQPIRVGPTRECQWIDGAPGSAFCGAPCVTLRGKRYSWCAEHHARVFYQQPIMTLTAA